jgi:predicted anti-sigma-YlaC factor YlaD
MASCKTVIANLSNYLDGEIAPEIRQKVEKHLRGCHPARRFTTALARCS